MRVAVVDDNDLFLQTIVDALSPEFDVDAFSGGADLLGRIQSGANYDIVLLDLILGSATALDLIAYIHSRLPRGRVIVMSGFGNVSSAVSAMKLGAVDFLQKPFTIEELKQAITASHQINRPHKPSDVAASRLLPPLGKRQLEVLECIAEGLTSKQIALRLNLSVRTVDSYRRILMHKFGATNAADLCRKYIESC